MKMKMKLDIRTQWYETCMRWYETNNLKQTTDDIPLFSFDNIQCFAKIVNIYDGDTFKACITYRGKVIKINCRALGYDSCEMKPRLDIPNREEHIKKAREAKEKFRELTTTETGLVFIHCHKFDKYGRVLVSVYLNKQDIQNPDLTINNKMIQTGHGIPYSGGKKNNNV